jgi:hypothetical protein
MRWAAVPDGARIVDQAGSTAGRKVVFLSQAFSKWKIDGFGKVDKMVAMRGVWYR